MTDFKTNSVPFKYMSEVWTDQQYLKYYSQETGNDYNAENLGRLGYNYQDEDTNGPLFHLVGACGGKPNEIFLLFRDDWGTGFI